MGLAQALYRLRNRLFGVNELDARTSRLLEANLVAVRSELEALRGELEQQRAAVDQTRDAAEGLRALLAEYLPAQQWESFDINLMARYHAGFSSAEFFTRELYQRPTFPDDLSLLSHCAGLVGPGDLVLEFGSWSGRTIRHLAAELPEHQLFGFDSFDGLPEDWRTDFGKGTFRRDGLPEVPDNVELVVGWFDQTLPGFLAEHQGPVGLVHIDCDLYSSTKTVLGLVEPRLRDGAVIVFDEFFNYPGWQHHEYRAFQEFLAEHDWLASYQGCNPSHQQVAVQLSRPEATGGAR